MTFLRDGSYHLFYFLTAIWAHWLIVKSLGQKHSHAYFDQSVIADQIIRVSATCLFGLQRLIFRVSAIERQSYRPRHQKHGNIAPCANTSWESFSLSATLSGRVTWNLDSIPNTLATIEKISQSQCRCVTGSFVSCKARLVVTWALYHVPVRQIGNRSQQ